MEIPDWLLYFLVFFLPLILAMGLGAAWYVSQPKKALSGKIRWKRLLLVFLFTLIVVVGYGYSVGVGCQTSNKSLLKGVKIFEFFIQIVQVGMFNVGVPVAPSSLLHPPNFSNCY